jgi:hypothetical protein
MRSAWRTPRQLVAATPVQRIRMGWVRGNSEFYHGMNDECGHLRHPRLTDARISPPQMKAKVGTVSTPPTTPPAGPTLAAMRAPSWRAPHRHSYTFEKRYHGGNGNHGTNHGTLHGPTRGTNGFVAASLGLGHDRHLLRDEVAGPAFPPKTPSPTISKGTSAWSVRPARFSQRVGTDRRTILPGGTISKCCPNGLALRPGNAGDG